MLSSLSLSRFLPVFLALSLSLAPSLARSLSLSRSLARSLSLPPSPLSIFSSLKQMTPTQKSINKLDYGVATISRLPKNTGFFYKRAL